MSINFFETDCKEPSRNDKLFGICDDQNGKKAYTDSIDNKRWIAKVINDNKFDIAFIAIDNCLAIYKEGTNDEESSCDGMLIFAESLYLIELKNQRTSGWIHDAERQLENTIKLLLKNHDLSKFRHKKAFACNRRHPTFNVIEAEKRKSFFKRTKGFRLDVQAEIRIK